MKKFVLRTIGNMNKMSSVRDCWDKRKEIWCNLPTENCILPI